MLGDNSATLDPAILTDSYGQSVVSQLFDGLVQFDANLKLIPANAEFWEASRDGRTWTFTLRRGVKFHNGREVTAQDVVYSLTRLLDPKTLMSVADLFRRIQGAKDLMQGKTRDVEGLKQEDSFDLVITDVVMPDMDGFQVMDHLRQHCPDAVVVAITAYVSTDSAIDALRRGAYDYLAKPFDFDLMHLVIKRALEKARMQRAFRHHMRELERQVAERTRGLTEANHSLRRSLADLRAAQEQLILTEKIRALGELTAVVAHELRDPLGLIAGFTQVLMEMAPAGSAMRAKLEEVTQAASRCHRIVDSLFTFTWRQPPRKVYTDITSLCEKALESQAFHVDLNQILVEGRFDTTLPKTLADPQQLQQALFNIALNACQAIMSGRGEGRLVVETKLGEGMILIACHDDGPGILKEHLGKVFDPFFTTREGRAGLGLMGSSRPMGVSSWCRAAYGKAPLF
jgi:signal transduction histidine kinase